MNQCEAAILVYTCLCSTRYGRPRRDSLLECFDKGGNLDSHDLEGRYFTDITKSENGFERRNPFSFEPLRQYIRLHSSQAFYLFPGTPGATIGNRKNSCCQMGKEGFPRRQDVRHTRSMKFLH